MDAGIIDSACREWTIMPPRPLISYYDQALKLLSNRPHAFVCMTVMMTETTNCGRS